MNQKLNDAIRIAVDAHEHQLDKQGLPYILHPLRVMNSGATEDERIVGVLHDVMEDNSRFRAVVFNFASAKQLHALKLLNRNEVHPRLEYQAYIKTLAGNPLARAVKINDLIDNLFRPLIPGEGIKKQIQRAEKYESALRFLRSIP